MGQSVRRCAYRPEPSEDSSRGGTRGLKARGGGKNRCGAGPGPERERGPGPQCVRDTEE